MSWRFVLAMSRREARASRRRLALYGSCMALGIAALVGLHGLRATVEHAVNARSQRMLGGDLRLTSRAPLAETLRGGVTALPQARTAEVTRFGSMALAHRSGRTRLVDVHALGEGFPLYGGLQTEPATAWAGLRESAGYAALVDPSLLIQLDTAVGEELALGDATFRIAGTIEKAPGAFAMQTQIAPRVFIPRRHLERTGLLQPGSLVEYQLFVRSQIAPLQAWLKQNRPALDRGHVRVQTVAGYQRDLGRSFGALTRYLGLVGLAALALGGVGVAAGIRVFVREKLDTVALLRSLGAQSRETLAVYGLLAVGLGLLAGCVGAALGMALQLALPVLLGDLLPVQVSPRLEPRAILTGIAIGLWVTVLFAVGPLVDLGRVPPLRALRRDFAAERLPLVGRAVLVVAVGSSLLGVSLWQAPSPKVGLFFAAGLGAALALLAASAAGAGRFLRRHAPRSAPYWLRQGIANLFRPRNHTLSTTLTLGFGVFLVATLHAVQHNVLQQITLDSRPERPNLVLFDVQPDQLTPIEDFLAERDAPILDRAPLISARIAGARGRPNAHWLAADASNRELRWALQREYRLTFNPRLRESETLLAGRWWSADETADEEPIPISVERDLAASLGVGVGDTMRWEIQGVGLESVVQSLREVDWGRFATNFFVVFPPGMIEQAPSTSVLLSRVADPEARAELQRDLFLRFPNVSVIDASVILRALDAMLGQVRVAVQVLALFTLLTGLMIVVAASAAARGERTRELLLLRTLGASSRTLRCIIATEALALGALATGVGIVLSLTAAWALVRFVFEMPFSPPWGELAALALCTVGASALLGGGLGRPVRASSPLAGLRGSHLVSG